MDNKSWLNSNKSIIAGIIFVLLLGFGGFFGYQKYTSDYSLIENQIEESKIAVDSIQKENKILEDSIIILSKKIQQIDINISKVDKSILNLKKETNEKINNVDNYTPNELQRFFTDRYNTDTIK